MILVVMPKTILSQLEMNLTIVIHLFLHPFNPPFIITQRQDKIKIRQRNEYTNLHAKPRYVENDYNSPIKPGAKVIVTIVIAAGSLNSRKDQRHEWA